MVACLETWFPNRMTSSQLTFSSVEGGVWSNTYFQWIKQTKPTSSSSSSPASPNLKPKNLHKRKQNSKSNL